MSKKIEMMIQAMFFVAFVQGCWAQSTTNKNIPDKSAQTDSDSHSETTAYGIREWDLYGKYVEVIKVGCLTSDGQPSECAVENSLTIESGEGGLAKISIGLVGANLHECQLEGFAAIKKDGNLEYRESYSSSGKSRECVLSIKNENGTIVLYDEVDRNCKRRYCGQRASFSGKKFPIQK